MKWILGLVLSAFVQFSNAQDAAPAIPIREQFPDLPPLSLIQLPDSTRFTRDSLHKRQPVIVMLFSPDCDHCHHQLKEILAYPELFQHTQLLLISNLPYSAIHDFYDGFYLNRYPFIRVAQDDKRILHSFYQLHQFPSLYCYNKRWKLIRTFEGNVAVSTLAAVFQQNH